MSAGCEIQVYGSNIVIQNALHIRTDEIEKKSVQRSTPRQWYVCDVADKKENPVDPELNDELNKAVDDRKQFCDGQMKNNVYTFHVDSLKCYDVHKKLVYILKCKDFDEEHRTLERFIQDNWIHLKENSNAFSWKKELLKNHILRRNDIGHLKNPRRAELAEWLLIKSLQNAKDLEDINTIQSLISQYKNEGIQPDKRKAEVGAAGDSREEHDKSENLLTRNQKAIEEVFARSDAITIKDHLVQSRIIDLKENEQLLKNEMKFGYEESSLIACVMDIIIKKVLSGAYACFIQSLETINKKGNRQRIRQLIDGLKNKSMLVFLQSATSLTRTDSLESKFCDGDIENKNDFRMTIRAENSTGQEETNVYSTISDMESVNRALSEIGASCKKTGTGSLVIHFQMIERSMQEYLKECLRSGKITTVVQMLFSEISVSDVASSSPLLLKVKIETSEDSQLHVPLPENAYKIRKFVPDNRSFLIEEMDTDAMEEGLIEMGRNIPAHLSRKGRRDRAHEIIDFILNNRFEDDMMVVINKNEDERFENLLHRLKTYKHVYMTEPSCLRKNLLLQFSQIVKDIDVEKIQDVLLERHTIEQPILKSIHERFSNRREIGMATLLLNILNSSDAVRALVDALFIIGWPSAYNLVRLQSDLIVVEKESKVELCENSVEENLLFEGSFHVFIEKRVARPSYPEIDINNQGERYEFIPNRMDKEDKRRYFVVGSVYLEIVTPLFQQKLEEKYKSLNFVCLKDFLDNKAVIHTLFHLRHRNAWCCTDKANCRSHGALLLNHHQWKQLYSENPGPGIHNCFCKFTAKSVKPGDLDVSLCGLILYNCCNLGQLDRTAIHILRLTKINYLSSVPNNHGITKDEYDSLMDKLKTNILQLDQTKEDELISTQNRPLDEALCNKYMTCLPTIQEVLDKINTKIDLIRNTVEMNIPQLNDKLEECSQYSSLKGSITKMDKNVDLRLKTPNNHVTRQDVDSDRMDLEDKRRYFIVGSVYLEIVTPLFQQNLENIYFKSKFRCLQDFLNSKPVIHILYHIRHQNAICCTDKTNCTNKIPFTITCHQWEQLYAEITGQIEHNCFCSYAAKSVRLEELDINLCGVILLNCCYLEDLDQKAINDLRQFKNDYLSHNTACGITKDEYGPLIDELKTNILQLDQAKEDELVRIQNRPFDEALCNKYMTTLLEKLEKIDTNIELSTVQTLDTINKNVDKLLAKMALIEDSLQHLKRQTCQCSETLHKQGIKEISIRPYQNESSVIPIHDMIDLKSAVGDETTGDVTNRGIIDDCFLKYSPAMMNRPIMIKTKGLQFENKNIQDMAYYCTVPTCFMKPRLWPSTYFEIANNLLKHKMVTMEVTTRTALTVIEPVLKRFVFSHTKKLIMKYQKEQRVPLETVWNCLFKLCLEILKAGYIYIMLQSTCMKTYDRKERHKVTTMVAPKNMNLADIASLVKQYLSSHIKQIIMDYQEKEMMSLETECDLIGLICKDIKINRDLHKKWYRYLPTDDRQLTHPLPNILLNMPKLKDGITYVACDEKPGQFKVLSHDQYRYEQKILSQSVLALSERK